MENILYLSVVSYLERDLQVTRTHKYNTLKLPYAESISFVLTMKSNMAFIKCILFHAILLCMILELELNINDAHTGNTSIEACLRQVASLLQHYYLNNYINDCLLCVVQKLLKTKQIQFHHQNLYLEFSFITFCIRSFHYREYNIQLMS